MAVTYLPDISNLHPSYHPSPPVPDVLPDASNCQHLAHKAGSYDQESLLES